MQLFCRNLFEPKARSIRLGRRDIGARGLAGGFCSDLLYRSMTVSWPVFFASAAVIFAVLNSAFAFIYFLGDRPVANAVPGRFLDLMYFSIKTLATVGLGCILSATDYWDILAHVR